jgi:DNA-binding MarR family transcriptional regulator
MANGGGDLIEKTASIGLGRRLRTAHMSFSRALRVELEKEGVTFGQFVHLERLWKEDGLPQAELSARVGVEAGSSTSILAELEAAGLVERRRDAEDRRSIRVHLTSRGSKLEASLMRRAAEVNLKARKGMSERDVQALFTALELVVENLSRSYPQAGRTSRRERLGP